MKYHLMQPVVIVTDTLNYGLPVGSNGYVVMIEPRAYWGVPYYVRVPSEQKEYWTPECDLIPASEWIIQESGRVIRDSLIDFALETKNKALFDEQTQFGREADRR
jgi:hypothetical protein